jgi:catechol 2,3-dioxygenase-like lactoylglutathione lyase family enzyme
MFGFELLSELSWEAPSPEIDRVVGLPDSAARGNILKCANCFLELWEYTYPLSCEDAGASSANDCGIRHLAFEVDDVHLEMARLLEHGGSAINMPQKNPRGFNAIYARDPFGNIVELMEAGPCFPRLAELARA